MIFLDYLNCRFTTLSQGCYFYNLSPQGLQSDYNGAVCTCLPVDGSVDRPKLSTAHHVVNKDLIDLTNVPLVDSWEG